MVVFAKMFQGRHSEMYRRERPPRLRRLLRLRDIFLIAQPPLLRKEGNKTPASAAGLVGRRPSRSIFLSTKSHELGMLSRKT